MSITIMFSSFQILLKIFENWNLLWEEGKENKQGGGNVEIKRGNLKHINGKGKRKGKKRH